VVPNFFAGNPNYNGMHFNLQHNGSTTEMLYIIAVPLTNEFTCPVSNWNYAGSDLFPAGPVDPSTPSTMNFKKTRSDLTLENIPLENPTRTLTGGTYIGQTVLNAAMNAMNAIYGGTTDEIVTVNSSDMTKL